MLFAMRPYTDAFFPLFDQAAANLVRGTEALADLTKPGTDSALISARLTELERDSDRLTHEVYQNVNATFVTPFERGDVYQLGVRLDEVMGHLAAAGDLFHRYELKNLPALPSQARDLIQVLGAQAAIVAAVVARLKPTEGLVTFWAELRSRMAENWAECARLASEGDQIHRALVVRLFSGAYDALTILKLKEIADELESACDAFERVTRAIEAIVAEEN